MWKYNTHIPCHDIKVGNIVRLDIDYDSGTDGRHCTSVVKFIINHRHVQCNSDIGRLYGIDNNRFSPIWINGNICRTCIYYKEEDGVEI